MKDMPISSPSEFYRLIRPEYFSDSEILSEINLPREVLSFELNNISTNQKQDDFETLCRKLSEKFIAPNLIPQVGPTGGGDGKTDYETHPVSEYISDRWFYSKTSWDKGEKWAFAISAKEKWKPKVKSDVEKIIGTGRGYTQVHFFSSRLISSKKKKDTQDELKKEFGIEVIIYDAEWILERVYTYDLIDLVVDTLHLSPSFKPNDIKNGINDSKRIKKLEELEKRISSQDRYFEYDYQLFEDALESAIISRMLEKNRDEIEGKFNRAERFCKKINNPRQQIRLYYQKAWTYLNWYDDYKAFIEAFNQFKTSLQEDTTISELELYFNLLNLLTVIVNNGHYKNDNTTIDLKKEFADFAACCINFEKDNTKPCSALTAKTYRVIHKLSNTMSSPEKCDGVPCDKLLVELSDILLKSKGFVEYPFESFRKTIQILGDAFNNKEYDKLVDILAETSSERESELVAGQTYLNRGIQKFSSERYSECIVFVGRAVIKLAKEETDDLMILALKTLSKAYKSIGLLWASNNCLVFLNSCLSRKYFQKGKLNKDFYHGINLLAANELFIGRLPNFLIWYEFLQILQAQLNMSKEELEKYQSLDLLDTCFAARILNMTEDDDVTYLPDLFNKKELPICYISTLFKLGYLSEVKEIMSENNTDELFNKLANAPFMEQIHYETNIMNKSEIQLQSKVLGCSLIINFSKDFETLLVAEMLLASIESFFATSLVKLFPRVEFIHIHLILASKEESFSYSIDSLTSDITVTFSNNLSGIINISENYSTQFFNFISFLLPTYFFAEDMKEYLTTLFKDEEIMERLSLTYQHITMSHNILGTPAKVFLHDWLSDNNNFKTYPNKRKTPYKAYPTQTTESDTSFEEPILHTHNNINFCSVIDTELWDQAKWNGFGFFVYPDGKQLGVLLRYENYIAGSKIFDKWLSEIGSIDKDEVISITIIKGIDKNNPAWYRVLISKSIEKEIIKDEKSFFYVLSRIHKMQPNNSRNLDQLLFLYDKNKEYKLCIAEIINEESIKPLFEKSITKKNLLVKNAWEIDENDFERVAIKSDDTPIIPDDVIDAPVLKLLKSIN